MSDDFFIYSAREKKIFALLELAFSIDIEETKNESKSKVHCVQNVLLMVFFNFFNCDNIKSNNLQKYSELYMLKKIALSIIIFLIIIIIISTFVFIYIKWPRDINLFGKMFNPNITSLDLSTCPIDTSEEWIYTLAKFKNLQTVIIRDKTLPKEKKYELEILYPGINFIVDVTINIFGLSFREDSDFIDLSNATIDDTILYSLKAFPKLKKVNILGQSLDQQLQMDLQNLYPNIEFKWNVAIADKLVENNIETLDLTNSKINNIALFKNSLKLLPNVKYIDMSECNLSNDELATLREELSNIKIVWTVHLGKWKLKTDAVAFSVLITRFDYVRMTSSDIEVLKYCTDLQALDLGHQAITDISIIGDYLPNLRILILADNKISDISPLSKLKHLHYLELFINRISDLSPLIECKELVDLNLCYNSSINFSTLINNNFPMLERVWIVGCKISNNNYRSLKAKYPKVNIMNSGSGSTNNGWRTHERYYSMINMFNKTNYISESFSKYDR